MFSIDRLKEMALEDIENNPQRHLEETAELLQQLDQLKAENEKMSKGYEELTEIVSPYIDDFTGYNEKLKGFDIVLCIKELMQQFDQFRTYHNDTVHTMLQVECCLVDNCKKYEQALQEIKELCKTPDIYRGRMALGGKIRKIISEVIKDEQV